MSAMAMMCCVCMGVVAYLSCIRSSYHASEPSHRYDLTHDMFLPPALRSPTAIGRARLGC